MATDLPLTYEQTPRPIGSPIAYRLVGDRLTVDSGRKVQEVDLRAVEQVRLTYDPRSFAQKAYVTKLRLKDGKSITFSSISWRSTIEARSQPDYAGFARALITAIAGANPGARFVAGRPPVIWGLIALLAAVSLVVIAIFSWGAYRSGAPLVALLGALIGVAGVWQLEPMVRLNRPRAFAAAAPPADLFP